MLKLTASYSKKVPVDGQDYSSQSYHAAVEVEIPDGLTPDQLQDRIHGTFELVRTSVESELNGGRATEAAPARREPARFPQRDAQPASQKQIDYLRDIAVKQGMTPAQLDDEANRQFGVAGARDLTRQQASAMIEQYGGVSRQRGRKAA